MDSNQTQPGQGQTTLLNQNQTEGTTQAAAQIQNVNQAVARCRKADRYPGNALSIARDLEDVLHNALDLVGDNEELYKTIDDARAIAEALIDDIKAVYETLKREADAIRHECDAPNKVECALDVADLRRLIMTHRDEVTEDDKITPLMAYVKEIKDILSPLISDDEEARTTMPAELHNMLMDAEDMLRGLRAVLKRTHCEIMRLSIRMLEELNDDLDKHMFCNDLERIANYLA